jgi:hypothetical protein
MGLAFRPMKRKIFNQTQSAPAAAIIHNVAWSNERDRERACRELAYGSDLCSVPDANLGAMSFSSISLWIV